TLETLHEFSGSDGIRIGAGVIEVNGSYLGAAAFGGVGGMGTVYAYGSSSFEVIHPFAGAPEGNFPVGGLVQAADGWLYGTANGSGPHGFGTLFRTDLSGNLSVVHDFDGAADGAGPQADLLEGSDGALYGTAGALGANGHGTAFRCTTSNSFTTLHAFS